MNIKRIICSLSLILSGNLLLMAQYRGGAGDGFDEKSYSGIVLSVPRTGEGILKMYPQPARSGHPVFIGLPESHQDLVIQIRDMAGKLILNGKNSGNQFILDTGNLPPAVYTLEVFSGDSVFIHKIIITEN